MSATFVIAQGGGPTAVINQTLVGAVLEAKKRHPGAKVLGARHGVRGIRDGDYVDLSAVPEAQLRLIAGTPSAALGSTRDKPDAAYCEVILAGLKKAGADAFIYIGGNDTAGTQQILAEAAGGSMALVHAPKTIDNDLVDNDHTPGFISAGEFVAAAFLSVDLDFRALPGVYVGIVMGRHAGFLTAAAATWRLDGDSGPHLIYVPERGFSVPRFIDDVRKTLDRHKRCIVAVSEGVSTEDGRSLVESLVPADRLERDAHGNVKLSGTDLRCRLRAGAGRGVARQARPRRHAGLHAARRHLDDQPGRRQGSVRCRRLRGRGRRQGRRLGRAAGRGRQDGDPAGAAVQRRRQDTAYAGRLPDVGREPAFRNRPGLFRAVAAPKKFEVGKPFV